jgi:CheY-like chemotaxis protein
VIMNLGVNARDAMPAGGKLSVACKRVNARDYPISGRSEGEVVMLSVSDTGQGMNEETRKNAFDPFFSTKTDRGGTGLGLATVLEIVKYHGGAIDLQTEIGRGTVFRIFLPAQQEPFSTGRETFAELPAIDRARSISSEATAKTVLVVDDNPVMRRSLARLLKAQGFESTLATNGQEGVEKFSESRPDLVLLDFDLPILSGAKVFERLRTLDPDIPIILMSGHATSTIESMSQWFGDPPLFLQKPYGAQDLKKAITEVLTRKGRR